jgi:hypothetical protein
VIIGPEVAEIAEVIADISQEFSITAALQFAIAYRLRIHYLLYLDTTGRFGRLES